MKTSVVPAQVTTVEDKIAGNLSLPQLLLLAAPIFIGAAVYIILPPMLSLSSAKLVISALIALLFAILAIRVRGKILLAWMIVISRYNLRPRYYVFDKNDAYLRDTGTTKKKSGKSKAKAAVKKRVLKPSINLSIPEMVRLENVIADPRAKLSFRTGKKGDLNVHITEIK